MKKKILKWAHEYHLLDDVPETIMVLLLTVAIFTIASVVQAQEVQRVGNTFISTKVTKTKEPQKTKFEWQDSAGQKYPIYISSTGSCFIIKISKKTGKEYRQYLGPEVSVQICKELGIEYQSKNTEKNET